MLSDKGDRIDRQEKRAERRKSSAPRGHAWPKRSGQAHRGAKPRRHQEPASAVLCAGGNESPGQRLSTAGGSRSRRRRPALIGRERGLAGYTHPRPISRVGSISCRVSPVRAGLPPSTSSSLPETHVYAPRGRVRSCAVGTSAHPQPRVATGTGRQPACPIKARDGEDDRVFQENKKDTHTPHTKADFSDGSVVETQHVQCRGHGFDSLSGN